MERDVEDPKAEAVKIDTRKPVVSIAISATTITRNDAFMINFDVTDPTPAPSPNGPCTLVYPSWFTSHDVPFVTPG